MSNGAVLRIVEALDALEHLGSHCIPCPIDPVGGAPGLQGGEEALHRGMLPNIAGPAHRADDAVICRQALELLGSILPPGPSDGAARLPCRGAR